MTNMNMIRLNSLLLLLFSLMVFGCASTSNATTEKSEEAKTFSAPDSKGSVFLYRTGRAVGAAGQLSVKVNGLDAGGTGPGTFFRWDLNPGTYTFLSSTGESSAVVQLEVEAGKVYFIRQDARLGIDSGRVTMQEVDSGKGENEVTGCKLLISSYIPDK